MIFTFITLTYYHEQYIIEHLESIKYQIENYGEGFEFQLIIADDASKDKTLDLIDAWVAINKKLFYKVQVITDSTNKGTCYNFTKTWDLIEGKYSKLLAGDDVYSCNNLFEQLTMLDKSKIVSGIPLLLIDGEIEASTRTIKNILASDIIYKKKTFAERLKRVGILNTPSIFIANEIYTNKSIKDFIRNFSVTEDYPMWIKMAEEYSDLNLFQTNTINVYYRRTVNSTYLVRKNTFNNDKIKCYEYMIASEKKFWPKCLLKNRLFCYTRNNAILSKVLNVDYYLYLFKYIFHYRKIIKQYKNVDLEMVKYFNHMKYIKEASNDFIDKISDEGYRYENK